MHSHPVRPLNAAICAAILALTAITVAITAGAGYPAGETAARGFIVFAPIAVGFYARGLVAFHRFGTLLMAVGAGAFMASLSGSDDDLVYSIGRVSGWVIEIGFVYLVLAFPAGRLGRVDTWLVRATGFVVALLFLPTALVITGYPIPSPWTSCMDACPGNAFMVANTEPAVVGDLIQPLRETLTVLIFAAATVLLGRRITGASRLMRRTLWPVLTVAILRLITLAAGTVARRIAPDAAITEVLAWLIALMLPALAVAFLVGLVRWRLFIAGALGRLATRANDRPGPDALRDALAEAFEDPSLEVAYWLDEPEGHWADATGAPITVPASPNGSGVTEARDGDRRVAAILHDPALARERAFIDSATSYAANALYNQRLSAQTSALLREARESRARIQAAADRERSRIEHDLHDGAQQRLVTLRIKLELAAEQLGNGNGNGNGTDAELLRSLGREVDEAVDEVRSLARGIYPAPLAARGLVEALRSAALRSALPASVQASSVGRYSREVESAAYFCCLEAMQNADKHALGATGIAIELSDAGALRFEVRDDGAGFELDTVAVGLGFTSMSDRLAAVGGEVEVRSIPGEGTRVTAVIPISAEPGVPAPPP